MFPRSTHALAAVALLAGAACGPRDARPVQAADASTTSSAGQAAVTEAGSQKSIAGIAAGSADHTTLVAALKAANLLDALANPGPLTVFAPVNAAFDKLPAGTVDNLLKPENGAQLRTVLQHHVAVSVYQPDDLTSGLSLSMLDGGPTTVTREGQDLRIDGAKVLATVRAGNGIVYVLDAVLLPHTK